MNLIIFSILIALGVAGLIVVVSHEDSTNDTVFSTTETRGKDSSK